MSWLFGAVHNALTLNLQNRFRSVHSAPIRSYPSEKLYVTHYPGILHAVKSFYEGKDEFASEVDWWLTFELWRRGLNSR